MAATAPRIKVVFSDLDGTLFTPNPEHVITSFTAGTIQRLQADTDTKFVVATGRPYPDVFASLASVGIQPDFYITSSGARIHDKHQKLLYHINMDPAVALDLLQLPCTPNPDGTIDADGAASQGQRRPRAFIANINCEDQWYTDKCLPEVRAAFHPSVAYQHVEPAEATVELLTGTHSVWLRGDTAPLSCVDRYLQRRYPGIVKSKFALPFVLDVFPDAVDKGKAVRVVCDHLGVPVHETACFADGWNDQAMLETVGHPFLLANAPQGLKDAVPQAEVIGSNDRADNGVAVKLMELFFNSKGQ